MTEADNIVFLQLSAVKSANLSKTAALTLTLTGTNKDSYILSPNTLSFSTVAAATTTAVPDAIGL